MSDEGISEEEELSVSISSRDWSEFSEKSLQIHWAHPMGVCV